jgi:hypothetical protein
MSPETELDPGPPPEDRMMTTTDVVHVDTVLAETDTVTEAHLVVAIMMMTVEVIVLLQELVAQLTTTHLLEADMMILIDETSLRTHT